jgi:hypothetical protein
LVAPGSIVGVGSIVGFGSGDAAGDAAGVLGDGSGAGATVGSIVGSAVGSAAIVVRTAGPMPAKPMNGIAPTASARAAIMGQVR